MSDELFQGLDVASASDSPFGLPADTYHVRITDVEVKDTPAKGDKGAKKSLVLEYTVIDGKYAGDTQQEWKTMFQEGITEKEAERNASWLKLRMTSLGIPENRINTATKSDLLGIECYMTLVPQKNNAKYVNIEKIELAAPPALPGDSGPAMVDRESTNQFLGV